MRERGIRPGTAARRSRGVLLGLVSVLLLGALLAGPAPAAVHTLTGDERAEFPDVVVDEQGTAHVVWSQSVPDGDDVLHYCRVPRGAASCDRELTFNLPLESIGPRTKINLMPTGELVITSERCCFSSARVFVVTSTDGGQSFSEPRLLTDTNWGFSGEVEAGPGNFSLTLAGGAGGCNDGIKFAVAPLESLTETSIDLTGNCDEGEYSTSVAFPDPLTPMVAYDDLQQVKYRVWDGSGSYNDLANWRPQKVVTPGADVRLAGGARGVYLLYGDKEPPYDLYVRRYDPSADQFGPPTMISAADDESARFADLLQDGGGNLHAVFVEPGRKGDELRHRVSVPGQDWRPVERLATAKQIPEGLYDLRVGAAPDGGGVAVTDHNGRGPIHLVPFAPVGGSGACPATVKVGQTVVTALEGCFEKRKNGTRVASGPVKVNGVDVEPNAATLGGPSQFTVTIDQKARTLVTNRQAAVRAGSVLLDRAKVGWKLPHGTGAVKQLTGADKSTFNHLEKYAKTLFELPVEGDADLLIAKAGGARIPANLGMPEVMGDVTGAVDLLTGPEGLNLDDVEIEVQQAAMGLLRIPGVHVTYDGQNRFTGTGKIELPPGYGNALEVSFGLEDGELVLVHLSKGFTPPLPIVVPPPPPSPLLGLDLLAFDYVKGPGSRSFTGSVGLVAGKLGSVSPVRIDGNVTLAFPVDKGATVSAGGKLSIVSVPFATGQVLYSTDGFFTFDGSFQFPPPDTFDVVGVKASVEGFVSMRKPYTFSAAGEAGAFVGPVSGSGSAVISSLGVSGCVSFPQPPPPADFIPDIGVSYEWGASFPTLACNVSDFKIEQPKLARAAGSDSISIPDGLPQAALEISGEGGAPRVTVTAPDGSSVTSGEQPVLEGRFIAQELPEAHKTYVQIGKPPAGDYTVVVEGDSPLIESVGFARGLPEPRVKAKVTGKGSKRAIRYTVRRIEGQEVTFAEQSATGQYRELGRAKGRKGSLPFRPLDARTRAREVIALVEQDRVPRARLSVARFKAPPYHGPAKPRKLRLRRKGKGLIASWKRARGARSYKVEVSLPKDGRRLLRFLKPKKTKLRLGGIESNDSGRISVSAIGFDARPGKAAKAKLKPKKKKKKKRGKKGKRGEKGKRR